MNNELIGAGLMFIGIYTSIILIPCALIARIGFRMIGELGTYPSKTPAIQLSILWKLVAIEIISLTLLILVYHVLVDPNKELGGAPTAHEAVSELT